MLFGAIIRRNRTYFDGYFYLQEIRVLFMYLNFSNFNGINIIIETYLYK